MNYLLILSPYAKAVTAFLALLIPFLASLVVVLNDLVNGQFIGEHLTLLGAATVALAGGTKAVHATPNTPKARIK